MKEISSLESEKGKGFSSWANGDIYEGEFRDDKRNGKGIFKFASVPWTTEGGSKVGKMASVDLVSEKTTSEGGICAFKTVRQWFLDPVS